MSDYDSDVLRYLLGLPQSQIDADIATASQQFEALGKALATYGPVAHLERTPEKAALNYHHRFIHAHAMHTLPSLPEDVGLFWTSLISRNLADEVGQAAWGQGRLAEIQREMKVIEAREGLKPGEYWIIGEGPDDHQELSDEADAIHEKVLDGVIAETLRRYRFEEYVKLFREDRMTFEVRNEVGRRLTTAVDSDELSEGHVEANQFMEERLAKQFGRQVHNLLRKRLQAVGLPPG